MSWRLLAVHAHPDDESITMGGTLAHYASTGVQVTLVTCTLGEEGEVIGDELAGLVSAEADQLGGYRHSELVAACRALGVEDRRYLGGVGAYRDSGMAGTPSADHERAFVHAAIGGADHGRAVAALLAIIDEVRPHVLLTYDEDGGYGHPDHITAHQVAVAAAHAAGVQRTLAVVRPESAAVTALERLDVPAGYLSGTPRDMGYLAAEDEIAAAIWVTGVEEERLAALAAHGTQLELLENGFALSNRIAQPLLGCEYYKVLAGQPFPPGDSAGDLFVGLEP